MPILESLFSGQAKNRWGVAYAKLGCIDCGLVTAQLLGNLAKPLEPWLREYLRAGHPYAAQALGALGSLDDASIITLAACLEQKGDVGMEAAYALCCCDTDEHEVVRRVVQASPWANFLLERARNFHARRLERGNLQA